MTEDGSLEDIRTFLTQLLSDCTGLPVQEIDPDTSLFDLGIDSLTVIELTARIQARHDLRVSPVDFFEFPTVNGLVGVIDRKVKTTR